MLTAQQRILLVDFLVVLRVSEQYSASSLVYQPLCSCISEESHHIPCIFLNSHHSFQKETIFTTSKRRWFLKYTGWRFKWFLGLAKVAIGSFHAPFERVYSLYFMQMATIHTWTHGLFHFKSLHIIYICIIACYRQSSWKGKESYAIIMSVVLWCLALKTQITQLINI